MRSIALCALLVTAACGSGSAEIAPPMAAAEDRGFVVAPESPIDVAMADPEAVRVPPELARPGRSGAVRGCREVEPPSAAYRVLSGLARGAGLSSDTRRAVWTALPGPIQAVIR